MNMKPHTYLLSISEFCTLPQYTQIIVETNYYNTSISAERAIVRYVDPKLNTVNLVYLLHEHEGNVDRTQTFHILLCPKKSVYEIVNYYNDNITHRFWYENNPSIPLHRYSYYEQQ